MDQNLIINQILNGEDLTIEDSTFLFNKIMSGELDDVKITSREVSMVIDRKALTEILGPIKIDFSDKNLVEQGFVFEQLINGHQCGCGESFTPVKDINKSNGPFS